MAYLLCVQQLPRDGAASSGGPARAALDDRVLPTTKVVSAGIVPVLTAAFVILYLFPSRTDRLWAWTIPSHMTAMLMGGGYLAGALFFARAARSRRWHRLGPGFLATTLFTTMLLAATVLHWDEFDHGHVSFWAWLALYVVTPPLLPLLWVRNRRHDPGTAEPGDRLVPAALARVVAGVGAAQIAFALVLFARPSLFLSRWPWPVSPLSARVVAAFAVFPAVVYLSFARERRWSALRWAFETAIAGVALIGVAAVQARGEFRHGGRTMAWRVGLPLALVALGAVWWAMRPGPAGDTAPAESG
jgi:hypothetical protein